MNFDLRSSTRTTLIAISLLLIGGCEVAENLDGTVAPDEVIADELQDRLDRVLDFTFQNRVLSTHLHGAWQVLHGVLAYQADFPIQVGPDGPTQSAVQYLLNGGELIGWTLRPGDAFDNGRTGLRAIIEPGTKKGQGHPDQWLAILAQCGLPVETKIRVAGQDFTISDLILQVQYDVSNNLEQEYSWTVIGLSLYFGSDVQWKAADGETWSIERLIQIELEQDLNTSACGGTHRMIGIAMAFNNHIHSGGKVEGVWAAAERRMDQVIEFVKQTQNPDGSFSANYFSRAGTTADSATALSTTGHILEFLTLSLTQEQLQEPWVSRAAHFMCNEFEKLNPLSPECGALYHAAHGLVVYRQRIYGEKKFGT